VPKTALTSIIVGENAWRLVAFQRCTTKEGDRWPSLGGQDAATAQPFGPVPIRPDAASPAISVPCLFHLFFREKIRKGVWRAKSITWNKDRTSVRIVKDSIRGDDDGVRYGFMTGTITAVRA
jgi:hypothetical protein